MKARIVAVSWLFVLAAGCSKGAHPTGDSPAASSSAPASSASGPVPPQGSATAAAGPHRYEFKTGIIQMTNSMFEKAENTLYFDDYGAKQANVNSMDMTMMGKTIHSEDVDIDADGYHIRYDVMKKTGTRQKLAPGQVPALGGQGVPALDIQHLSEEMKKQMKVEPLPSKTIDGKEATGTAYETMGIKVRSWVWKGIALYTEMDMSGMNLGAMLGTKKPKNAIKLPPTKTKSAPIVMAAKSVQVDVPVPADRFTVPPDVTITDM